MKMEQMGGASLSQIERDVQMGNIIQTQIAQMHGEDLEVFADTHGGEFRSLITNHPELVKKFEKDQ
jgi:hypothetical protein